MILRLDGPMGYLLICVLATLCFLLSVYTASGEELSLAPVTYTLKAVPPSRAS